MDKSTILLIIIFICSILLIVLIHSKNILIYFKMKKYFVEFQSMINRLFDNDIIPLSILLSEKTDYIKRINGSYQFLVYTNNKFLISLGYDLPFREVQIQTIIDILKTESISTNTDIINDPELLYDISELLEKLELYKSALTALSYTYFNKFISFLDDIKEKERNYMIC